MNWFAGIVTYVVTWWVVLFCVLPIGVRHEAEPEPGHDPGAPANPRLWFKVALTTGISAVVFLVIYLIVISDWISFRRMS
jgi:predicted secreted protein